MNSFFILAGVCRGHTPFEFLNLSVGLVLVPVLCPVSCVCCDDEMPHTVIAVHVFVTVVVALEVSLHPSASYLCRGLTHPPTHLHLEGQTSIRYDTWHRP